MRHSSVYRPLENTESRSQARLPADVGGTSAQSQAAQGSGIRRAVTYSLRWWTEPAQVDHLQAPAMARMVSAIDRTVSTLVDDAIRFVQGAPLRGEIPWAVVSIVCDVVYEAGRRSVDVDALKDVAEHHGSRILALDTLPPAHRQHAVELLHKAIFSAVVLCLAWSVVSATNPVSGGCIPDTPPTGVGISSEAPPWGCLLISEVPYATNTG